MGGKGLRLWLLIRNCGGTWLLVPVTAVPALRSARRGWGPRCPDERGPARLCAGPTHSHSLLWRLRVSYILGWLFSEAIDTNVSCSDSSDISSSSFLCSAEAPGEYCSNRSKTGCCFSLLILSCSEFCCSGWICSVSCLYYQKLKSTFRKQVFSLIHRDIFIREVLSFTVFLASDTAQFYDSCQNQMRRGLTLIQGLEVRTKPPPLLTQLTKRPDRISVST